MSKGEKVIFLRDNQWGEKYQVKELRRGFVAYLLPREEVVFYNAKNLAWVEKQKQQTTEKIRLLTTQAQVFYEKIHNFTLSFTLNKNEKGEPFGSVNIPEILAALVKAGFNCRKNQLLGFRPLHQLGENLIKVKVRNNLIAHLKIIIN